MHGEKAGPGKQVVHDREDGLLHQPQIIGPTEDETELVPEVDDGRPVGAGSVSLRIAPERLDVQHRPAPGLGVLDPRNVLGEHVVGEHGVRRVLTDEAIGYGIARVRPHAHILHVEYGLGLVDVAHDPLEQPFIAPGVERLEAVLPPHLRLHLRPRNPESVVHGPSRAGGIGQEDERSVQAETGGVRLGLVLASLRADATPVALDRFPEERLLAETVAIVAPLEAESPLQVLLKVHLWLPEIPGCRPIQ